MTTAMESEEDLPSASATPESLLIGRGDMDAVQRAIEQLPVIFREVILLCDVEEGSYREIAEILSIPGRDSYVTAGQSPEVGSRVTPRSCRPTTRRRVSSKPFLKSRNIAKRTDQIDTQGNQRGAGFRGIKVTGTPRVPN
jgi:RNA polymerase sigma-70 factor (ECF subfamily)